MSREPPDQTPAGATGRRGGSAGYYDAGVLLGSCLYLYVNLFALPATPYLLGGDQVLFWVNAQRLLRGEVIYRDFLEFTPPGADVLYLGAFALLGSRIWVPNVVVLVLGVVLCWLCFHLARSIMKPRLAVLVAAFFMVLDYGKWLSGTHHWFSVLAVMGATAVLLEETTHPRIVLAGALLGVATFFTQTRGPIAALGIAAYLAWEGARRGEPWPKRAKSQLLLFAPLAVTWTVLSGYFIAAAGFSRLWYFQVSFVRHYVATGRNSLSYGSPEILSWLQTPNGYAFLLMFCMIPVLYAVCLWIGWNRVRSRDASVYEAQRVVLLALTGAAMYVEVAHSPNAIRLYCVAVPAVILIFWLATTVTAERATRWVGIAAAVIWMGLIGQAARQTFYRHADQSAVESLPAGTVATLPQKAEKLGWLARHTQPGQLLFEANWVEVYVPLALRNPAFTDQLESGHYTRPEFVDQSIRQLRAKRVQYVLWTPRLESPLYHFGDFRQFLADHYRRVVTFTDGDEVWERL
jgi:hypothetical protein